MNIKKANLTFGSLTRRTQTTGIILHHPLWYICSIEDIHRSHRGNGWSGVGYHYLVRKNGEVWEGRPHATIGAHAGPQNNSHTIGICFEGNFHPHSRIKVDQSMSKAQFDAGQELIWQLFKMYPSIQWIKGHKEVGSTACPGQFFPLEALKATPRTKPTPPPPTKLFRVQVGAFGVRSNADTMMTRLRKDGYSPFITQRDGLFRVQVGAFGVRANAERLEAELKRKGYQTFIV